MMMKSSQRKKTLKFSNKMERIIKMLSSLIKKKKFKANQARRKRINLIQIKLKLKYNKMIILLI